MKSRDKNHIGFLIGDGQLGRMIAERRHILTKRKRELIQRLAKCHDAGEFSDLGVLIDEIDAELRQLR